MGKGQVGHRVSGLRWAVACIFLFLAAGAHAVPEKFETKCRNGDCFRYGWVTTGLHYTLSTKCKENDCTRNGWRSVALDLSTYDVVCKPGGCFAEGWYSRQKVGGQVLEDEVSCRMGQCLVKGWTVRTGYDSLGGDVTCHRDDCSKFGGSASWRGRPSRTDCYAADCYHRGWTLWVD